MQQSALDVMRARVAGPLGKARDAQDRAIARLRLMRDDAKFGSRQWHDANAVVEDLEAVEKQLDGVAEAVQVPPAKPATEAAAAQPPKGYTAPAAQPPAASKLPGLMSLADVRAHAAAGCEDCKATLAIIDGPLTIITAAVMRDKTPAPNGVGVTDRAE